MIHRRYIYNNVCFYKEVKTLIIIFSELISGINMKLEIISLFLFALVLFSCSGNDEPDIDNVVPDVVDDNSDATSTIKENMMQSITGRWQLVRQGELDFLSYGIFIEFDAKGIVVCEYGVGSDKYKKEVYTVNLEDDWSLVDRKAFGHIVFPLCGENRFQCFVEDDQLILLPDEGNYYIVDPTKYFVKVN